MRTTLTLFIITLAVALTVSVSAQNSTMTFFVSSTGSGMGGNLGGLAGADKHCQALAAKAGAGNRTWRAYLSTSMPDVHARDRIGKGPWQNAKGVVIAANVDELHTDKANINNDTALDEMGRQINPQGAPNRHDIMTGSTPDGRATTMTCQNWTSSASDQTGMLGHHDRLTFGKPGSPWNSAHASKGCSQDNLVATGGAGLIYCFAGN
jgi:ABC-type antimicrobial peptide transport system permease subunit